MRILIVVDVYPPEISSAGHLMQELAEGFKKRGHQVTVATTYPRHYLRPEVKKERFKTFSVENGIEVIRVKTLPLRKINFIIRGISQLLLPQLFFRKIRKFVNYPLDGVIVYSPPLTLGLMGSKIKRHYGAKFVLSVQDIFPQNAIDLGVLKNRFLIKFFEWIEKKVYKDADVITFNSEKGKKFLIEKKALSPKKVITFYNWIDFASYQDLRKNISFRARYNLGDKFIFLFAGIMGPAQDLGFIVKIAKKVSDIKDIIFLLVGDGMEKEKLKRMVKEDALSNVIVESFVSKEEYPYLLKDVDVGVVCLSPKNKTSFIPGKFMGYLGAGLPIVAFLNEESDGFPLIDEAGCGYACRSNDLDGAVEIVKKIYGKREELEIFGKNARKYALSNLTVDSCIVKFEKLFNR
ncbi:MAG: glycosyltransferase family 4 protein [Candidatus Paceibacterota bacterium]|jgi:glycosyltransferase involved in cell wall biosynthesis